MSTDYGLSGYGLSGYALPEVFFPAVYDTPIMVTASLLRPVMGGVSSPVAPDDDPRPVLKTAVETRTINTAREG